MGRSAYDRIARLAAVLAFAFVVVPGAASAADDAGEAWRRGVKSPKSEARVEAARAIARGGRALSVDDRHRTALVLREALRAETDGAARVEEIRALAALDDPTAWITVLVAATTERDERARDEAKSAVVTGRSGMLDAAARLRREDDDPTFRADLCLLLGRRRRADAVPLLLDALGDSHARVATAAAEALEAVSGKALGYDAVAWRAWWTSASPPTPPPGPAMEVVTREAEPVPVPPPPPPAKGLVPPFYGLPLPSKDVVFVLDVSGSVGASGLDSVKGELLRTVERLASDVRISALFFDQEVRTWHPETVPATPAAKEELAKFVRGIPRGKRTDVMTPLNVGLAIVRKRVQARLDAKESHVEPVTMVVVSDGLENLRETPGDVVTDRLDRLDLSHAIVHAIVVGGRDNALMAALATRGGGRYLVVP